MRRQDAAVVGVVLIAVAVVLGATVFREDVAQAAQGILSVREQNFDSNGNIKVHEQGTANVNITNQTLPPLMESGRLILVANNIDVYPTRTSDWAATGDCSRVDVIARWHGSGDVYLQVSADGNDVADATFLPSYNVRNVNVFSWAEADEPVVAPYMRVFFDADDVGYRVTAWLFCMP